MNKDSLAKALKAHHQAFSDYLQALSPEAYAYQKNGEKWSAGQELSHILKSVSPINQALAIPKLLLKSQFGKSNRPSRTYEGLVDRYQTKLKDVSADITNPFVGTPVAHAELPAVCDKLLKKVSRLGEQMGKFSEEDMDLYILPHPLLGKLTLREIMYFTIYHVQHHQENSRKNLADFAGTSVSS